jgi:hypothetical protein
LLFPSPNKRPCKAMEDPVKKEPKYEAEEEEEDLQK